MVERLWSIAKLVMTDRRRGLSPIVFEAILFLNQNADLWGIEDIVKAIEMNKRKTWAKRFVDMDSEANAHQEQYGPDDDEADSGDDEAVDESSEDEDDDNSDE